MSSTNKTSYYELSQYVGTDKPTYLGDYNSDMLKIDTAIHEAATDASTAVSTANTANATATTASTNATSALSTANIALETATTASETAGTASANASAALMSASAAETAAAANTITNLAPAYDPTLTYAVGDLVTYIDAHGSGKLYKCIVAVDTPEAFNINKWDDKTASEIFGPKYIILGSVESDGIKSYSELLDELYSYCDTDITNYKLIIESDTYKGIYHYMRYSSGDFTFTSGDVTTNEIDQFAITIKSTSSEFNRGVTTSNATTLSSLSSNVPIVGYTLSLFAAK